MGDVIDVEPADLTNMAKATDQATEHLTDSWQRFVRSSVAPADAFGSSTAGAELAAVARDAAQAADVVAQAASEILQYDADALRRFAGRYEAMEHHSDSLLSRLTDNLGGILW